VLCVDLCRVYICSKYSDTGVDNVQFIMNVQKEVLQELCKSHVTRGKLNVETTTKEVIYKVLNVLVLTAETRTTFQTSQGEICYLSMCGERIGDAS
jgi:hypothetical protein